MRRVVLIWLLIIPCVWLCAPVARCQESAKVLLFIRGGSSDWAFMLNREVGVMRKVLQSAGVDVVVATVSGEPISVGALTLTPDLRLRDVKIADYEGFILPCMAAGNYVAPGAVAMVREAAAAGKAVAAQYNSIWRLAEAGLLEGKKYAYRAEIDVARFPVVEGAMYAGSGVVRDGNVITSGMCPYAGRQLGLPDHTEELSRALVDAIRHRD